MTCGRRREPHPGENGGSATGPSPVDRGRSGSKYPPPNRRHRSAAGLDTHRRQPQRRHPALAVGGGDPTGARTTRTTETTPQACRRRSRLRPRDLPPPTPRTRRNTTDRAPPDRARLRTWQLALGRRTNLRTNLRLATPVLPTPRPLRTQRTNPPSTTRPRLLPDLLQTTSTLVVL